MYQYRRRPEPFAKFASFAADQWKKPKLSNITAITMVANIVIEAPPILLIMSMTSGFDTSPVMRIMLAPTAAGHASFKPRGRQKITIIVKKNTIIVIHISMLIFNLPFYFPLNKCSLSQVYIALYSKENKKN